MNAEINKAANAPVILKPSRIKKTARSSFKTPVITDTAVPQANNSSPNITPPKTGDTKERLINEAIM